MKRFLAIIVGVLAMVGATSCLHANSWTHTIHNKTNEAISQIELAGVGGGGGEFIISLAPGQKHEFNTQTWGGKRIDYIRFATLPDLGYIRALFELNPDTCLYDKPATLATLESDSTLEIYKNPAYPHGYVIYLTPLGLTKELCERAKQAREAAKKAQEAREAAKKAQEKSNAARQAKEEHEMLEVIAPAPKKAPRYRPAPALPERSTPVAVPSHEEHGMVEVVAPAPKKAPRYRPAPAFPERPTPVAVPLPTPVRAVSSPAVSVPTEEVPGGLTLEEPTVTPVVPAMPEPSQAQVTPAATQVQQAAVSLEERPSLSASQSVSAPTTTTATQMRPEPVVRPQESVQQTQVVRQPRQVPQSRSETIAAVPAAPTPRATPSVVVPAPSKAANPTGVQEQAAPVVAAPRAEGEEEGSTSSSEGEGRAVSQEGVTESPTQAVVEEIAAEAVLAEPGEGSKQDVKDATEAVETAAVVESMQEEGRPSNAPATQEGESATSDELSL